MKKRIPFILKDYLWDIYTTLMGADSIRRFDRIVAILIQLQSKRIVKAQDMADRFQVSLRTVYRDIRTLEAAGVPISSEAGTGYSIMEGYRLPPVMFTREEAGSFVAAEKLMQKFTDKSLGAYHDAAMFKIKSVLRGREKDWVEALETQVAMDPGIELFNENIPNALEILFESIAEKRQVKLRYLSVEGEKPLERQVEPVGLFHENNFWYLMAYCHLRQDYRQFRTDRMHAITRTALDFSRAHGTLEEYRNPQEERPATRVRILVDKRIARYLAGSRKYYGFQSQQQLGDKVEMTFLTTDAQEAFPRWFLMFADYGEILEPRGMAARVKELAARILNGESQS